MCLHAVVRRPEFRRTPPPCRRRGSLFTRGRCCGRRRRRSRRGSSHSCLAARSPGCQRHHLVLVARDRPRRRDRCHVDAARFGEEEVKQRLEPRRPDGFEEHTRPPRCTTLVASALPMPDVPPTTTTDCRRRTRNSAPRWGRSGSAAAFASLSNLASDDSARPCLCMLQMPLYEACAVPRRHDAADGRERVRRRDRRALAGSAAGAGLARSRLDEVRATCMAISDARRDGRTSAEDRRTPRCCAPPHAGESAHRQSDDDRRRAHVAAPRGALRQAPGSSADGIHGYWRRASGRRLGTDLAPGRHSALLPHAVLEGWSWRRRCFELFYVAGDGARGAPPQRVLRLPRALRQLVLGDELARRRRHLVGGAHLQSAERAAAAAAADTA